MRVATSEEVGHDDGVVWATDGDGAWFVTDYDPDIEVCLLGGGAALVTARGAG